jgi:N-acetylmuramoyl-L-alanine amidase
VNFRRLTAMDAPEVDAPDGPRGIVSRRRLLQLAGAGGLGAAAATLSSRLFSEKSVSGTPSSAASNPEPSLANAPSDPLPPPPAPTPTAALASGVILCRESWGAKPALPGGVTHTLSRMTLHHTGAVLGDNRNAPGRLRQHQQLHQGRGWIDIAYHVSVDRDGNIYELRNPKLVGDTATEYNPTGHFLVLCEGNFDEETVTDAQLHGAALAFAWSAQQFNIPTATLAGHRDFAATECPGTNLYAHLTSGDIKRRVEDMVSAGPVNLQKICGPEAAAKVAAIEAGQ